VDGLDGCNDCSPGKYGTKSGATSSKLDCTSCPEGWFQDSPGNTTCIEVESGYVVGEGRSASIQVPFGSKICGDGNNTCTDKKAPFEACAAGTYGGNPRPTTQCHDCEAGKSSSQGATKCQEWYVYIVRSEQ